MQHSFISTFEASNSKLFNWQLRVPKAIVADFLASPTKQRVWCTLQNDEPHQCALTPIGGGEYVIKVNTERKKLYALAPGMQVEVSLAPDDSEFGLPMPEELDALLQQDENGAALFNALTKGKQRTLLFIILQANGVDKRIGTALAILQHLKTHKGKIDFRALYHDLRGV